MKTEIELRYHACVMYDIDHASVNKADKFFNAVSGHAFEAAAQNGGVVTVVTNSGGPCWGPYIDLSSPDRDALALLVESIEAKILSYRAAVVK